MKDYVSEYYISRMRNLRRYTIRALHDAHKNHDFDSEMFYRASMYALNNHLRMFYDCLRDS